MGTHAFLFGGLTPVEDGGKDENGNSTAVASDEFYHLKLASNTVGLEWQKLQVRAPCPQARWRHTATMYQNTNIMVFGGFHTSDHRLNDVWVFDALTNTWRQPNREHNEESMRPFQLASQNPLWPNAPPPRASHTATLIGENMIYIFGGYGGAGYSRRDLDDLYALNVDLWTWTKVICRGSAPERRSSHQAAAVEKLIFIMGGCSSAGQFQDIYSLDTEVEPHTWSKMASTMPSPTWNFSSCAVLAIPTWKIFTFGGVTGKLSDADRRGKLQDSMMIFDTGINRFIFPKVDGTVPSPRSDAALAYDSKGARLLVFGGWSEKWQSDLYSIDVSNIVGPPYAVLGMNPNMGPVTGGTEVKINGIDFTNTSDVRVRFGLVGKQSVDVQGYYESKTMISCVSPDFTKFPAGEVDVRVALGGDTFTTTCAKFTYFTVTNADTCIIYGPGVLSGCATNEEVSFIIQARDDARNYRTTGGDEFNVTVDYIGAGVGDTMRLQGVTVQDLFDGRYVVTYVAKHPGKYKIEVHFLGTFGGTAGPVKGSGVEVEFSTTANRECNSLTGSLVIQALKNDVEYLQRFTQEISSSIFVRVKDESWSSEEQIRVLMNVKEALLRADTQAKDINLLVDRAECVLAFMNEQEVPIPGLEEALAAGKSLWERIVRESNQVLSKIAPIMRAHAGKIRGDILSYEAHVLAYKEELQNAEYYKFSTGPVRSKELLGNADAMHLQQKAICEKMKHIANVFDCIKDMDGPISIINEVGELLSDFRVMWDRYVRVLTSARIV
jgi:dynein heavy chain